MSIDPMTLIQMIALRRRNRLPSRLAALVRRQTEAGNMEISPDGIRLTPAAILALEQYCREHQSAGRGPWILPQQRYYRRPLPQSVIVLPKNE